MTKSCYGTLSKHFISELLPAQLLFYKSLNFHASKLSPKDFTYVLGRATFNVATECFSTLRSLEFPVKHHRLSNLPVLDDTKQSFEAQHSTYEFRLPNALYANNVPVRCRRPLYTLSQGAAASALCLAQCPLSLGLILYGGYHEFVPLGSQLPYCRTTVLERVVGSDMNDTFKLVGRRHILSDLESLCSVTSDGSPDVNGKTFVNFTISLDTTL